MSALADGRPDVRHAPQWLTDAAAQLIKLGLEHNDARLHDLAATLRDVVARADILPTEKPGAFPTRAHLEALRVRLLLRPQNVQLFLRPFDLPSDYVLAQFADGFTCGIAPDGAVSS